MLRAWTSRSIITGLLILSACPSDPDPQPAEESSSGPGGSTSTGTDTTPQPTTAADTSTGPEVTSSTGPDVTSSTGPDDTTGHQHSTTGPDDTTGDTSSSGDPSTSGTSSGESGISSSESSTGPAPIDCSAGDGPDFVVGNNGAVDYVIDGVNDPAITVVRGCSYTFTVNAPGHPFLIKTMPTTGVGNQYNDGVANNGAVNGVITWDVPAGAPDTLYYICQFHAGMTNTITVIDP